MSALDEFSASIADAVAAASPAVVGVGRAGSGVIVADGLVATNAHNVQESTEVSFADGATAAALVAGADLDGDLAVLAVGTGGRAALEWAQAGEGQPISLGQLVIGLARPRGGPLRAGVGFVSGLGLDFRGPGGSPVTGAVEHTAPLARGSSGGPVVDTKGRLVGINTHREGDGFYLALPAGPELRSRVEALGRGEVRRRAKLGVALAPPRAARR
ncbi:MAG: S1C family serine protease, partial [Acidimicrobiales bacterium]